MNPCLRTVAAAIFIATWATPSLSGEFKAPVVAIHDGDTLTVLVQRSQVKIRLVDIDAPELKQPFGRRSRQSLVDLCARESATVLDRGKDRYGRTLGQVTCRGINANAEQVRRGMAWVFERYAPKDSYLYALQAEARSTKQGLWVELRPVAPWDWRYNKASR